MGRIVRTRGAVVTRGARRQMLWDGGSRTQPVPDTVSNFANANTAGGFGFIIVEPGVTLVRTRGHILTWLSTAAAADTLFPYAFGMIKVSLNAFNAGVGSMPSPMDDVSEDWIVHRSGVAGDFQVAPVGDSNLAVQRFEIDSKAQRKTKVSEVFAWIFSGSGAAGDVLTAAGNVRMLFKLS